MSLGKDSIIGLTAPVMVQQESSCWADMEPLSHLLMLCIMLDGYLQKKEPVTWRTGNKIVLTKKY